MAIATVELLSPLIEVEKQAHFRYRVNVFFNSVQRGFSDILTGAEEDAWYQAYIWAYTIYMEELTSAAGIINDEREFVYLNEGALQIMGNEAIGTDCKNYVASIEQFKNFWGKLERCGIAEGYLKIICLNSHQIRKVVSEIVCLPRAGGRKLTLTYF